MDHQTQLQSMCQLNVRPGTQCRQSRIPHGRQSQIQFCRLSTFSTVVFTARRVCIARTMPWQDVCPSVRHMPVLCLDDYTYTQSFSPSGCSTILVFSYPMGWKYSDRNPLNGGVECKWYETRSSAVTERPRDASI